MDIKYGGGLAKIQRRQDNDLKVVATTPWYVSNGDLHVDLKMSTINEKVENAQQKHRQRLDEHVNLHEIACSSWISKLFTLIYY